MNRFGTRDLLALVALVAIHFAICKFAVDYREQWIAGLAFLTPALITALIHLRFQLPLQVVTVIHYPICLVWAFAYGVTYSMYWNRVPHHYFERDSVGLDTPLRFGVFCLEIWVFVGIVSTIIYAVVAWLVASHFRGVARTNETEEP